MSPLEKLELKIDNLLQTHSNDLFFLTLKNNNRTVGSHAIARQILEEKRYDVMVRICQKLEVKGKEKGWSFVYDDWNCEFIPIPNKKWNQSDISYSGPSLLEHYIENCGESNV